MRIFKKNSEHHERMDFKYRREQLYKMNIDLNAALFTILLVGLQPWHDNNIRKNNFKFIYVILLTIRCPK